MLLLNDLIWMVSVWGCHLGKSWVLTLGLISLIHGGQDFLEETPFLCALYVV